MREHEQMGRDLTAVGIRADFQYQTDWPTFLKMLSERRAPAFLHAWYADVPDPDNFLHLLFHSQSPRNYMGYANPEVDDAAGPGADRSVRSRGAWSCTGGPSS